MYYALWNGETTTAQEVVWKMQRHPFKVEPFTFLCPECHQPVRLIQSNKKRPYFAHVNARMNRENESDWHRENKKLLQVLLTQAGYQVAVEAIQEEGERRADILVDGKGLGRPIVLELQSSRLDSTEVYNRYADYAHMERQLLWLLNPTISHYQLQPKHLNILSPFIVWISGIGLALPYWLSEEERVALTVLASDGTARCQCLLSITDYLLIRTRAIIQREGMSYRAENAMSPLPPNTLIRKNLRILHSPTRIERCLLTALYQHHLALANVPSILFGVEGESLFVEEKLWMVMVYSWLVLKEDPTLTTEQILRQVHHYLHHRPLLCNDQAIYREWLGSVVEIVNRLVPFDACS
ncbi:MAG: competence protein CoiA family protein [Aerococcus sp.]|nr:competence protein CoiA family protein [Aerococcus sp.]